MREMENVKNMDRNLHNTGYGYENRTNDKDGLRDSGRLRWRG